MWPPCASHFLIDWVSRFRDRAGPRLYGVARSSGAGIASGRIMAALGIRDRMSILRSKNIPRVQVSRQQNVVIRASRHLVEYAETAARRTREIGIRVDFGAT
jgi:hypothetical protein